MTLVTLLLPEKRPIGLTCTVHGAGRTIFAYDWPYQQKAWLFFPVTLGLCKALSCPFTGSLGWNSETNAMHCTSLSENCCRTLHEIGMKVLADAEDLALDLRNCTLLRLQRRIGGSHAPPSSSATALGALHEVLANVAQCAASISTDKKLWTPFKSLQAPLQAPLQASLEGVTLKPPLKPP